MAAFNGSGYADKASGETFLQSYTLYNKMRHRDIALEIIETFPNEAMEFVEHAAKGTYSQVDGADEEFLKAQEIYTSIFGGLE